MGSIPRQHFTLVSGQTAVLEHHRLLCDLAERCGQPGVMDDLEFYLSATPFGSKVPHLVLLSAGAREPYAAVLLFEYKVSGFATGIYVPSDFDGERTVLAPKPLRAAIARQTIDFMFRRRANVVLLSVRDGLFTPDEPAVFPGKPRSARTTATQTRQLFRMLPLEPTLDATLARMGSHTRRNLRAFRRKTESEAGATFVLSPDISEAAFLAINRASSYPVPANVALWRLRTSRTLEGGLFAGLLAADGRWLSLVGGRHRSGTTFIDWQMNLAGLPSLSLGTAMRAWLLDYEVSRGSRFLHFEGGTPHSMHTAFLTQNVSDLLVARRIFSRTVLQKLLPRLLPEGNLLAETLTSGTLVWNDPAL